MYAKTRGRQPSAARTRTDGSDRSTARRRRTALGTLVAVGLVAAACSSSSEAGPDDSSPTFARENGSSLALTDPVASVSDLVAPATEGDSWTIVGSIFDPEATASVATVWASDDARGWESASVDPAASGTGESMSAAIHTDDGMVAVGQAGDGAEADAVVWRQADGEWSQVQPEAMAGDHEQWAFDVVSSETGLLVAGGESVWGEVRPRLWFSTDGETWKSVDGGAGGPLDATGEESVRDIAAIGSGFVAVGSRTLDNEQDGVVWYSPDGETWEQVEAAPLAGNGRQELLTVATTEAGLVAGGYTDGAGGQGVPVVWTSTDGIEWSAASGSLPMGGNRIGVDDLAVRSISVGDQGLIAAGGNEWRPHVWRSADNGATWDELPNPVHGELFEGGVALRDAQAVGDITVALGTEPSVLLLDGASRWQDATDDSFPRAAEQPFATSAAVGPEGAIAAGGRRTAPSGDTRETFSGQVWLRNGDGWDAVETDQLGAGHILDAVPFAGGFAAVGLEDFGIAQSRRNIAGDEFPDGLVWVSRDGKDWARIGVQDARIEDAYLQFLDNPTPETAGVLAQLEAEAPPGSAAPAGGSGTQSLDAVAPIGRGFIAVGSAYSEGDADPIVIVSPDGTSFIGEQPVAGGRGTQRYHDVCVAPDDSAVAVGVSGSTRAYDVIVGKRQPDGAWVAATENSSFGGGGSQQAYACAASDDGYIVVGSDDRSGNADARVWTSEDGVTWTELESGLLGGSGDQWASAVAPAPEGGWLVAGTDTAAGDGDIALWRISSSGDVSRRDQGETALSGPGEQSVSNIAIDEDGHVTLVGNDYGRVGLWQSDTLDR